ncbi:Mrp/NBP35 family ATP-binding protein [Candidatus Pelagibacter sp.]|nr:Mrp/NBP35 family ATP-binding protein [Candidatus Pelagibacter sp.]|tara:strand:- start:890 stop:1765 length:876 start_codon:yes stop_codon:yes gene_type:complete
MQNYIVSLLQKTSNDKNMSEKKPELSDAMKRKLESKKFSKNPILGTKFTIAISSAKGGVGKSSFATNLALALKKIGLKIGLLDADIYGPSVPKMFGITEKPKSDGQKLEPILKYDIQCMSIGFLTDQQTPMIWRGPMVTSAIKTFTQKVNWQNLDFIIIDMPPGTGDTQLTFSQEIKMDGAIIISTPQEVALLDVKRGIKMFEKLGVKILGLVDNMSFFLGDDGKKYNIFGEGGVKKTAEEFKKEFLGEIPIDPDIGKFGDEGKPLVEANPSHEISKIYINLAKKIKEIYL